MLICIYIHGLTRNVLQKFNIMFFQFTPVPLYLNVMHFHSFSYKQLIIFYHIHREIWSVGRNDALVTANMLTVFLVYNEAHANENIFCTSTL